MGVWNTDENRYDYQAIPLYFPEDMVEEANGKVAYYGYRLKVKDNGIHRILAGFIPPYNAAKKLMIRWLKYNNENLIGKRNGKAEKPLESIENQSVAISGGTKIDDGLNCQERVVLPDGTPYWYDCEELVVTGGDPNPPDQEEGPSGGSWPDTIGDDDGGDNDGSGGCPAGCGGNGGYDESDGEHDTSEIYVTYTPEVKYPEGSNYESMYPKLTEYLKNKLPRIKDNQTIINAIEKYGDLSAAEVKNQLKYGEGPVLKVEQLDNACGTCSAETYGLFKSDDQNSLYIDLDLVADLENTTPGSKLADSFSFLVGVTILHELVHFSEWTDGAWNSDESGVLFEEDVYGQTVWRENADIVLERDK
ncbi:MAG: hypothetical protein JXR26_09270 [Balneolaceae bacterium]|nr:hypothetical protein [Balneolaceae bacterium]